MTLPITLPSTIAGLVAGRRVVPVTTGMSGARVLRFDAADGSALYLKTVPAADETSGGEAARLRWMARHGLPVPAVLHHEIVGGDEHLLLGGVAGTDAATAAGAPDRDPGAIVAALADGLRLLHDMPIADCPFRHTAAIGVADAHARATAGLVDVDDFDDERIGRSLDDLLAELDATRPAADGAAFTHGDYCLPNVILRGAGSSLGVAGFVDCGRAGVGDPYRDLALAVRSVHHNLGDAWVPLLLARYGVREVDEARLRFYLLLDEFF